MAKKTKPQPADPINFSKSRLAVFRMIRIRARFISFSGSEISDHDNLEQGHIIHVRDGHCQLGDRQGLDGGVPVVEVVARCRV